MAHTNPPPHKPFPINLAEEGAAYHKRHPRIKTAQRDAYLFALHRASVGYDVVSTRKYRELTKSSAASDYIYRGLVDARARTKELR